MDRRTTVVLLIAPALTVILVMFAGGLSLGLTQSLDYFPAAGRHSVSLDAYRSLFADRGFLRSLGLTLFVSLMSTVGSLALGLLSALALRGPLGRSKFVHYVYQVPLTVPHLVVAIGLLMVMSQSGLLSRIVYAAGIIESQSEFPILVRDNWGIGIMIAYIWKQIPFIGLIALSVLQSVAVDYEKAAQALGANRWQRFRHVLLPLVMPGLVPASIIIFAFVFGSFEVPLLLGKSYPSMLSVLAYRLYVDVDLGSRPQAMATSVFIGVFVLILVIAYRKITAASRYGR
jgi:putative spermidine/putrescine transport system permease protein